MAEERNGSGFQIIPAVDVVGEEAVRLRQGDFARVVAQAGDPAELVARYAATRPPLIHVVDLDGARSGTIRPDLVAKVAAAGWERETALTPEEFAGLCAEAGVPRLLCTAIERDGTLAGPDLALLERVRSSSGLPVLAAGGIRSDADLDGLAALGLEGAVVGRALLEGALT